MQVLVTGGDGFVGEHLVAHLLDAGYEVTASSLSLPPIRNVLSAEQMQRVEWKGADVLNRDATYRLVAAVRPDFIYHLAGFSSGADARRQPEKAVQVNTVGTVNLCEAIVAARGDYPDLDPRMLVMSSGDVYGNPPADEALTESVPLRPTNAYGLSKACQELVAHTYRRGYEIRSVVARAFNLIGPGQRARFVVPDFCLQAAAVAAGRSESALHVGNLDVKRDFTDVRDGVRALRAILELPDPRPAYNVCSGRPISIADILGWILDEAGVDVPVVGDPARVRREEPRLVVGDPTLLEQDTGWKPTHDVEETVRATYRWAAKLPTGAVGP